MTNYRIIKILSIGALIPLFSAFIFPFIMHESETSTVMFFWIWGLPFYSSFRLIMLMFPFMLLSIGIAVEMIFLLKSFFILRKDNIKIAVISRDWIKRGRYIIHLELLWILWLLVPIYYFGLSGMGYIEVSIFLPLIGGTMLIIAGNLSRRLEIDKESVLNKGSNLKSIYRLYIFVFILYSIFFLIFFTFFIFPSNYIEYVRFNFVLYSLYYIYPMMLILLIIKFDNTLDNTIINNPHEHKQLNKLYIMTFVIIGVLILIYFLLNWIRPMFMVIFNGNGYD